MGIELCQDLRHRLLHQIIDIHGIDILIVDDMKQVVEFVTAGVDDVQPVAREMVGIERTDQDTDDHTDGHPKRCKTYMSMISHELLLFGRIDIHKDHLDTCPAQQVDAIGETILFAIDHPTDAGLDDELGTLDTG